MGRSTPGSPRLGGCGGRSPQEQCCIFLGSTRVGCISARRSVPEEAVWADLSAGDEREEGGARPTGDM